MTLLTITQMLFKMSTTRISRAYGPMFTIPTVSSYKELLALFSLEILLPTEFNSMFAMLLLTISDSLSEVLKTDNKIHSTVNSFGECTVTNQVHLLILLINFNDFSAPKDQLLLVNGLGVNQFPWSEILKTLCSMLEMERLLIFLLAMIDSPITMQWVGGSDSRLQQISNPGILSSDLHRIPGISIKTLRGSGTEPLHFGLVHKTEESFISPPTHTLTCREKGTLMLPRIFRIGIELVNGSLSISVTIAKIEEPTLE